MSFSLIYRKTLSVLWVAGFFTGLVNYLFLTGSLSLRPATFILFVVVLALPLAVGPQSCRVCFTTPLVPWCGVYAAMTIVWFMGSSQSSVAVDELTSRLLSVIFLLVSLVTLSDHRAHDLTRWCVVWSVLVGVALNVYDFIRPLTFSPILGRAAGLYLNPNTSGSALVLGMVITIGLLRPRARAWYLGFVGLGVLLTLSRGAMLLWVVAVALLIWFNVLRVGAILRAAAVAGALAMTTLVLSGSWETVVRAVEVSGPQAGELLRLSQGPVPDYSLDVRREAATTAWRMFAERPLLGYGVGATVEWSVSESTHNIIVRHLVEYGIAGLFLMPALALAIVWRSRGAARRSAICLGGVLMTWGTLSHNVLDERYALIAIALVGAMAADGRLRWLGDRTRLMLGQAQA